jgi:hypothetical protein
MVGKRAEGIVGGRGGEGLREEVEMEGLGWDQSYKFINVNRGGHVPGGERSGPVRDCAQRS